MIALRKKVALPSNSKEWATSAGPLSSVGSGTSRVLSEVKQISSRRSPYQTLSHKCFGTAQVEHVEELRINLLSTLLLI